MYSNRVCFLQMLSRVAVRSRLPAVRLAAPVHARVAVLSSIAKPHSSVQSRDGVAASTYRHFASRSLQPTRILLAPSPRTSTHIRWLSTASPTPSPAPQPTGSEQPQDDSRDGKEEKKESWWRAQVRLLKLAYPATLILFHELLGLCASSLTFLLAHFARSLVSQVLALI
jgi:hypothetical protein